MVQYERRVIWSESEYFVGGLRIFLSLSDESKWERKREEEEKWEEIQFLLWFYSLFIRMNVWLFWFHCGNQVIREIESYMSGGWSTHWVMMIQSRHIFSLNWGDCLSGEGIGSLFSFFDDRVDSSFLFTDTFTAISYSFPILTHTFSLFGVWRTKISGLRGDEIVVIGWIVCQVVKEKKKRKRRREDWHPL